MPKQKHALPEAAEPKRRKHRTPEQVIADLQKKIEDIKARAVARSLKRSPAMKLALASVRTLDKGLAAAASEDNDALRQALTESRAPLATFLAAQGMRLPKARGPRRRTSAAG